MKDIFLILNPGAHSGRSQRSFEKIIQLFGGRDLEVNYYRTDSLKDALSGSRQAHIDGYKTIVAVGGDGTINAVINSFYDQAGCLLSPSKFGVIYTGTSPDFNKSYHIPTKIEDAVDSILQGRSRPIPVGRITFGSPNSVNVEARSFPSQVRYFACCANIGLGAQLARRANSGIRHRAGDFLGTLLSLTGLLVRFKSFPLTMKEEELQTLHTNLINLSIGITPFIASGIRVPVQSIDEERKFYKLTVQNLKLTHILPLLRKVYSGKPFENNDYLQLSFTREIALSSAQPVEIEADGDPIGFLPCTITLALEDLPLIIPTK